MTDMSSCYPGIPQVPQRSGYCPPRLPRRTVRWWLLRIAGLAQGRNPEEDRRIEALESVEGQVGIRQSRLCSMQVVSCARCPRRNVLHDMIVEPKVPYTVDNPFIYAVEPQTAGAGSWRDVRRVTGGCRRVDFGVDGSCDLEHPPT